MTLPQDIEFPLKKDLSYQNYLTAVYDACSYVQYNFGFSNGQKSKVKANAPLEELKITPSGTAVKRVVLWYDSADAQLVGIQLFDKEGQKLLETGWKMKGQKSHETILKDDERIIGFRAR